jgi:hypothetical protein
MSRPLHLIPDIQMVEDNLAIAQRMGRSDLIRSAILMRYVHQHPWVDFDVDLTGRVILLSDDDKVHFILKCT